MASDKVLNVGDSDFDDSVLKSATPVLVDFWAVWCGPCKAIAPIVDKMADEHAGKLSVAKVDVDRAPGVAQRFGVRNIPTLLVFKNGEVVGKQVGACNRAKLLALVTPHMD